MNALGILVLLAIIAVVLGAPRRWALIGIMTGMLYLTQALEVQIFGFNMYAMRFVELAGFARIVLRREYSFSNLNRIDWLLVILYCYSTIVYLIRADYGQVYQIGLAVDALLCYFTFRGLIRTVEEFRWFLRAFVVVLIPYVALVSLESFTAKNPFAIFGDLGAVGEDWFRNGRIRCQGSFRHPSLLGTLGASFLPLYISLWFSKGDRKYSVFGLGLCAAIIWATNSGGPLNFAAICVVGWLMWRVRAKMQLFRRLMSVSIIALGIVMKAPIWYLPAKVSSLSGGDGWHRSYLLEMAYKNLGKWWFAGMGIEQTRDWFPYNLEATGGADMTNTYLGFGITAGLLAMALFIGLLVVVFKTLGKALALVGESGRTNKETSFLLWGFGVMIAGHATNWLGIIYFDQTYVLWFMQLAIISSVTGQISRKKLPQQIAVTQAELVSV